MKTGWPRAGAFPVWSRGFPFYAAQPRSPAERLRAAAAAQVWRQGPVWKRAVLIGGMMASWPVASFVQAVRAGREMSRETGEGWVPSFVRLYGAALGRNVPPGRHAMYRLASGSEAPTDLLFEADQHMMAKMSQARGAKLQDVQDKARFERICKDHGLPCVGTIAMFEHGRSTGEERLRTWTGAIFVKALTGNRGAGAERWTRTAAGFISSAGIEQTPEQLIAHLRAQNCIVQPVIEDCEPLRELGSVALSSLRVISVKGATIPATIIAAALSLADKPDSLTSHPGTMCGIDVETGAIVQAGAARAAYRTAAKVEKWNRLLGIRLPFWSDAAALVRKAHEEAFPEFVTLGWDVALTPGGPVLLEANINWGLANHQLRTGPLGRTALGDVIDELLQAPAKQPLPDRRRS